MELQQQLAQWATRVERNLELYLIPESCIEPRLIDAMRYALLSGGKRIRPALVYMSCLLCGGTAEQADRAAAAIEAIHCYSLVHDDLPAMDDDELRRGHPTCHIAFDEATAILAGDALQCFAFELLSTAGGDIDPNRALQLIRILARASGSHGMVMGQAFDLAHVGDRLTLSQLQAMHAHKTGRLITASVMLGATAAGCQDSELLDALQRYGDAIGLAFQVQDDLLDIEGTTLTLGKPQGSDEAQNKPTYPALLGVDGARTKLNQLYEAALEALKPFGVAAAPLASLAHFIVTRDH
ncbi:(2E,6E)-farnesyl diphosphate synthase [Marinobacterium zhoushanense]|uniref:(2E,6E)-farnesyl diphosphate synthase n=1 Tax=Marinobacterium zhoushanense TaxID=1679163 RepID=A0ABQ1KHP6_9GAMM|nr:farnesyl diphosphate synthase [Marinobacterium zhoushanense]GGB98744.1 (2E,6E)-farnesyl diphosphate synthase [Marinobacterium zhoushanense]